MRITRLMGTIRITGAIDRHEPDPQAPGDPLSSWIGTVSVAWLEDGPRGASAALIKVCTGRGTGDLAWGQHVLQLRWIGDPPPVEIAQAVYDFVRDRGPGRRTFSAVVDSQPRSEARPSYRISQQKAAS